jgi:D-beta-D-heptose 7-phosphate kinase/D-beta-D-heptose 1-phosphate adenosyltransferase
MNLEEIINSFKGKKILIVGDLILDRFIYGRVNRISPEAPVPIVEVNKETFLLGGAANVANNIWALGGIPSLAGIIGQDTAGNVLRELLKEKDINLEGVLFDKRHTTVKTRIIAHNQQVVRFDKEDRRKLEGKKLSDLKKYITDAVKKHDAVIISDYKKGVITGSLVETIVKNSKMSGIFVAVDPKIGHFNLYKNVSLITPNINEASSGAGIEIKDEKSLIKAGKILIEKLLCKSVLITRSEEGMSLFEKIRSKYNVTHIPTFAKKVYDVTGAGDTVIATITLAHAAGASLKDAAIIANYAAGIVVGEVGTAVVSPDKLIKSIKQSEVILSNG